jgi:hypothetical protein
MRNVFKNNYQVLMVGSWLRENAEAVKGLKPSQVRNMLVKEGLIPDTTSPQVVANAMKTLGLFQLQPRVGLKGLADDCYYKLSVGLKAGEARKIQALAQSYGLPMAVFCRQVIKAQVALHSQRIALPVQGEFPFGSPPSSNERGAGK